MCFTVHGVARVRYNLVTEPPSSLMGRLCIFFDVWRSLDPVVLLKNYLSFVLSFIQSLISSRNVYGECTNARHYSGC